MRVPLKNSYSSSFLLTLVSMACASFAWADTSPIDFHQTVIPILKDSCFACHVSGADAPYASKDPVLEKHIQKITGNGVEDFTMGEQFPFPDDDPAAKQLKHLEKELSKGFMPPAAQAKLGLGLPLSDKYRKILLNWVAQEKNNLH